FVLCLAVGIALLGAPAHAATTLEWRADLDQLVQAIVANHPDPFVRCGRLTFLRAAQALSDAIPSLSEEQRMVGAMRLVAMLGDTHSQLTPMRPDFALWYAIRVYEFSDGYYVTAAHKSVAELAGARILEVAGRPVEEAMRDARSVFGADNEFAAREYLFAF